MKSLAFIAAVALAIGLAAYSLMPRKADPQEPGVVHYSGPRPTTINLNPVDVFQRSFWRHPSPADKILHAEKREWADGGSVTKWQWFIVVEASPELVKHLRQDDAFGLIPVQAAAKFQDPPVWFTPPSSGVDILQAPGGNMQLIFNKAHRLLYATDSGQGFTSATPEQPAAKSVVSAPAGRLPTSPPPNPKRE